MQSMPKQLRPRGGRAWHFLDATGDEELSVPILHYAWSAGPNARDGLRAALSHADANELFPGCLKSIQDIVAYDTAQHFSTHVRTLIPAGVR